MAESVDSITTGEHGSGGAVPDLLAQLTAIERAGGAPKERAAAFLEAVVAGIAALAGTATVSAGGDEHELRRLGENPGLSAWVGVLDAAALEARSHARSVARLYGRGADGPAFAVIACPISTPGGDPFGGVAVLVRSRAVEEAERVQLHVRSACLHAARLFSRTGAASRSRVEMDDITRIYNRAGGFKTLHEFAYAITNAARQRFSCLQAAMGSVKGGRVKLLCISGLDSVKKRSPGVHRIEQAMGECADLAHPVVGQPKEEWADDGVAAEGKLHLRWRGAANNACVLSVPVVAGEEVVAVLSFRRPPDQPFDADDIAAVQKLIAPLAGAIPLVARATAGLRAHATTVAGQGLAWLAYKGSIQKRAAAALCAGAAVWLLTASSSYHINTRAVVVAERQRVVASPIEGLVAEVLVRDGDRVDTGDPLILMDTAALRLEASETEAEIAATEIRLEAAIAEDNPGAAAVARAERRSQRVRLLSVQRRIGEAVVRAPAPGIVVGPELSDSQGRLVAAGHPLLSIAERGSLELELMVPESRAADLQPGAQVRFASHARPEQPGLTGLVRVAPAAVERDSKRVFLAEAPVPEGHDWLRPGMEGTAIIDAGERPNWWLATHGLVDAARLRFWID